jgi:prohibitin 2
LEWLKSTRWDGKLPLVTGGAGGQGVTPFIQIPSSRSEVEEEDVQTSLGNITTSSSNLPSSTLNRLNPATPQQ